MTCYKQLDLIQSAYQEQKKTRKKNEVTGSAWASYSLVWIFFLVEKIFIEINEISKSFTLACDHLLKQV